MADIRDAYEKAFSGVRSTAIIKDGALIATVNVKRPRDGAGRLYAYLWVFGCGAVRGMAGNYGYDKTRAATNAAFEALRAAPALSDRAIEMLAAYDLNPEGGGWKRSLERAGYLVVDTL